MPATLVDYDMACEDEVSRSIRAVLKTPMQLAAQIPSHSIFNELYSFTFACTHQTWGSGHLPIVGLLQYVPLNLSSQVRNIATSNVSVITVEMYSNLWTVFLVVKCVLMF